MAFKKPSYEAIIVGGFVFVFGLNGYLVDYFLMPGVGGVAGSTLSGVFVGGLVGEAIAMAVYAKSQSFKNIATASIKTALAAVVSAAIGGAILFAIFPGGLGSTPAAASAIGALGALAMSGRIGFDVLTDGPAPPPPSGS